MGVEFSDVYFDLDAYLRNCYGASRLHVCDVCRGSDAGANFFQQCLNPPEKFISKHPLFTSKRRIAKKFLSAFLEKKDGRGISAA